MSRRPHPVALALIIAAGVVALQVLLVPLFAGPATSIEPRDLPVVVAGPAPAATALRQQLEAAKPGAFEIAVLPDEAAADQALRDREAYAAFVVGAQGVSLHTASAASPTVAALLTAAAGQLGGGKPVPVVDVVPTGADDPRGGGFAAGFFPLALTAMAAGVALFMLVRRPQARLVGLVTFAVLAGAVGATLLQTWLGVVGGDWLAVAAVLGLLSLAISASVAGLASLIGPAGIGLVALLTILVGNALSGVGAAPELLPQPWGAFGQWLPIGAGATLLRSTAWFGGAGGATAAWVLTGWAVAGLTLVAVAGRRSAVAERAPAGAASDAVPQSVGG